MLIMDCKIIISSLILHRKVATFVTQIKNQISNQMKKLFVIATLVGFSFCVSAQTTPAAPAQTTPAATTPAPAKTEKMAPAKKDKMAASAGTEAAPAKKAGKKGAGKKAAAKKDAGKMESTPAPADKK
jgi:hypothetical protein